MDAPNGNRNQQERRPLGHVEGLPGSSDVIVALVRLMLRTVVLGSRASMNVAAYLDSVVERVAETYLHTGVDLLNDGAHIDVGNANGLAPPLYPLFQVPATPPAPAAAAPPPVQLVPQHQGVEPAIPAQVAPPVPAPAPALPPPAPAPPAPAPALPPPAYGVADDLPQGAAVAGPAHHVIGDQHLGTRYYAVFVGRQVGVFDNWSVVHGHVNGVPGNSHRRYGTEAEAIAEFNAAFAAGAVLQVDAPPVQVQVVQGEPMQHIHLATPAQTEEEAGDEQEQATNADGGDAGNATSPGDSASALDTPVSTSSTFHSLSEVSSLDTDASSSAIAASSAAVTDDEYSDPEFDLLCSQVAESVLTGETVLRGKGKEKEC